MKFTILNISAMFALLASSVAAQGSTTSSSSASSSSVQSSSTTSTSTSSISTSSMSMSMMYSMPMDSDDHDDSTHTHPSSTVTSFYTPTSTESGVPLAATGTSGALPTGISGIQQIAVGVVAGLIGAAVL